MRHLKLLAASTLALAVTACNPNRTPDVAGGVSDENRPASAQNPYGQTNSDAHNLTKQQPGAVSSPTVGSGTGNDVSGAVTQSQSNADARNGGVNNPDSLHQPVGKAPSRSGDRFSGGH